MVPVGYRTQPSKPSIGDTAGTAGGELAARGIKTKIGLNVIVLLLLSALITDILVVTVLQGIMMRDAISQSRMFTESIGHLFFSDIAAASSEIQPKFKLVNSLSLAQDRVHAIYIIDDKGQTVYQRNAEIYTYSMVAEQTKKARLQRKTITEEKGVVWSLFWWYPEAVTLSIPILKQKKLQGVVSAIVPLTPIFVKLKKYHNPILIFLLINTAVLTVVGLYRIFKHYLRPIDRIVQQADGFHEESDIFFVFRHEDNELNRLSSSLNRMLDRIASDKKKLQATVASLEQANIELKNTQSEMISTEKMASVGRLAAGIAHEIGNPIGIVLGYLEMLKQGGLGEKDKSDFLQRTEDEVQRISTIIRQLLDLARPREGEKQHVTVNTVLSDLVEVMRTQPVMSNVDIECRIEAANDTVWGKDDQLRQVFLNLLLNAADAIHSVEASERGKISIRTSIKEENDDVSHSVLEVLISDTGNGIGPETLQNIFDPFYTTKEPGKGTGLGLSVSYMIIEGMGGTIKAESGPGEGATFRIELPLVQEENK